MPESAQEYYDRLLSAVDDEGRLPVAFTEMPGWDIFPYEPTGLRLKPLAPLFDEEPARQGEDPATCRCIGGKPRDNAIWTNDRWTLLGLDTGIPITAMLIPEAHHDLADLPPELAREMGELLVVVARAIEALPSVGRCQVARYGDGSAHVHLFFFGRPARVGQFRGSTLVDWEENLPRLPEHVAEENARFVAETIVTAYGGRVTSAASGAAPADR
jgi:diadenosine tetraphosphate (Ap4A) HIT family hydrolase